MKAFVYLSQTAGEKNPLGPTDNGVYQLDGVNLVGRLGDIRIPAWAKGVSRCHLLFVRNEESGHVYVADCSRNGNRELRRVEVGNVFELPHCIRVEIIP